jgi:hypothetical protein
LPKDKNHELIGGFAVALWSLTCRVKLVGYIPEEFTSKDVDFRGGRQFVNAIAEVLKPVTIASAVRKHFPNMGKVNSLSCPLGECRIDIEVLEAVPWVDKGPKEPLGYGYELEFDLGGEQLKVAVLDPVSLFFAKTHALSTDTQKNIDGLRNDPQHILILNAVIDRYLEEIADKPTREDQVKRLKEFFSSSQAKQLETALREFQKYRPEIGQSLSSAIQHFQKIGDPLGGGYGGFG